MRAGRHDTLGIVLTAACCLLTALLLATAAGAQYAATGPLLPSERLADETPRTVAASEYRDAYCAKWTDGCASCERATANDEPKCLVVSQSACERKPVECRTLLKTAGRVCLAYRDGCNTCLANFGCTAQSCPVTRPDGTMRERDPNYQCYFARRARYENPSRLSKDLEGNWRLTDPRGRTCEIVNGLFVSLTPACLALGEPVTAIRAARMSGSTFEFTPRDGAALLTFETSNPDDLQGTGASQGYRLTRLEAEPLDPGTWEGSWVMRFGRFYACDMFLMMRPRVIGPLPLADMVHAPHGVSFASNCLSPTDPDSLRISHLNNEPAPARLPAWTSWRTEGREIVFADDAGRTSRFIYQADGTWSSDIPRGRLPSITVRLERKPR